MKKLITIQVALLLLLHAGAFAATGDSLHLSLDSLFKMASETNRQIRLSVAGYERASAALDDKRNSRLPQVDFSASAGYLSDVGVVGLGTMPSGIYPMPHFANSYGVQASWLLYSGGRISASIDIAGLEQKAAGLNVEKSRQEVRLVLAGYYLDLYQLYRQRDVYRQNLALSEALLDRITDRYQSGIALRSDQLRNELLISTYKLALSKLQDRVRIINYNLVEMLALPEDTQIVPDIGTGEQLPDAFPADITQLKAQAVADHPETLTAGLAVDIAGKKLRLARSANYPEVSVFATNAFNRPYAFDIPAKDIYANNNSIGLKITYSLGGLYANPAKVKLAKKEQQMAKVALSVAEEARRRDVNSAAILYRQAIDQMETFYKQQDLANENYRRITDNYLEQLALNTEVMDASNQKLSADLQIMQGRAQMAFAYYQLLKSLGKL